mmetsp:Transcript_6489/g.11586  ORF Transcript_6489/g.11586 Transcript_6489/m.11586 type:complete len:86 (-) Transcript_6489:220-477(-)
MPTSFRLVADQLLAVKPCLDHNGLCSIQTIFAAITQKARDQTAPTQRKYQGEEHESAFDADTYDAASSQQYHNAGFWIDHSPNNN